MLSRKVFLSIVVLSMAYAGWFFWPPDIKSLRTFNPARTRMMIIRMAQAKAAGRSYKIRQDWVSLDRISVHLRHAVLVSEDARFYEHRGVDWESLRYCLLQDIRRRKFAFGGSTITQQLAKNLFLSPSKSPLRKLREMEIALLMERILSKRRILEIYLNVIEWGNGIFGAEAAAQSYFNKSAADLSPEEAASLAATLPSPRRHSPVSESRFVSRRKDWVLKWMDRSGFLPAPESNASVFSPPVELLNERNVEEGNSEEEVDESNDGPANPEASNVEESTAVK